MIKKVKKNVPLIYVIINLSGVEIAGTFHETESQKRNQKLFRV